VRIFKYSGLMRMEGKDLRKPIKLKHIILFDARNLIFVYRKKRNIL
jgi:hypothetical protein